jgi:hypothetical protein
MIVLACGLFLVGCGGGSGSSNGDNSGGKNETPKAPSISFSELEGNFSAFSSGTANIYDILKEKQYNVSQSAFDDFNTSILAKYSFDDTHNEYSSGDLAQIKYYANYNSATNILAVSIATRNSTNFPALNDDAFDDEFNDIGGNITQILSRIYYDDNISLKYGGYAVSLNSQKGFNCSKPNGGKYKCQKEDDTFVYIWQEENDYSYIYGAIVK